MVAGGLLVTSALVAGVVILSVLCDRHARELAKINAELAVLGKRIQANRCDDEIVEEAVDSMHKLRDERRRLLANVPIGFGVWLLFRDKRRSTDPERRRVERQT